MSPGCPNCGAAAPEGAKFCGSCGASLVLRCSSCDAEVPPDARFCLSCGAPQKGEAAAPPAEQSGREERKIITVLFADLVGFTSSTEQSDPEDVRAKLSVYHRHIREDVERHGGNVEKLMGDGVFAAFGAPTAHEDDPERAVRAALRIQESVARLNEENPGLALSVRIAVTTGEAIVQLDRTDRDREGIIGDVVNTASRLEGVAEPGTVVVDERTYAGARATIEFEPLPEVTVKGKAEPLEIWKAIQARSRLGGYIEEETATPFVGRQSELDLLVTRFERAQREGATELVTIIGEPGVGKTRLLTEFRQVIDDLPDIVWWRQGRCLPYGEGITFWAIGEVLKAHAGILDSDSPATVDAKLGSAIEALIPDPVRASWVRARLGALIGGDADDEGATQQELFAALVRFFEAMAANRPLVLVIEDLQWADATLLDFVNHLIEWAVDVPILLVGTARPELLDMKPDWGGGKRNASTVGLSRLSDEDTARLIGSLLGRTVIDAGVQKSLLERCAGNPLYVTEFVRYAAERGILNQLSEAIDTPMPDSVQALIAARLDLLDVADKSVLQAASAVGRVFWTDSLTAISPGTDRELRESLRRLSLRELIRSIRQPSMEGQEEWAFSHALITEVAYRQIPKGERRRFHISVARWIRNAAGDRLSEVAELLAHHYDLVAELGELDDELKRDAYAAMHAAATRVENIDARRAELYYDRAIGFAPTPTDRVVARLGRLEIISGEEALDEAVEMGELALAEARETGDMGLVANCLHQLAGLHWYRGDNETNNRLLREAVTLLDSLPPSEIKAKVLDSLVFHTSVDGKPLEALGLIEEYRDVIMSAGAPETQARMMQNEAGIRLLLGDASGLQDSLDARAMFLDRNMTAKANAATNNYATWAVFYEPAASVAAVMDEAISMCLERGYTPHSEFSRMTRFESWFPLGRWDEILADADEILEADAARGGSKVSGWVTAWKARIALERHDVRRAKELNEGRLETAFNEGDAYSTAAAFALAILVGLATGDHERGLEVASEYADFLYESPEQAWLYVADVAWPLVQAGGLDTLIRMVAKSKGQGSWGSARWAYTKAVAAYSADELAEALELVDEARAHIETLGHVYDPILYSVLRGRILLDLGKVVEATGILEDARVPARRIRALRLLGQIDALLEEATGAAAEA